LPEISAVEDPQQSAQQRYGIQAECAPALKTLTHVFTHFRLHINPQPMHVQHIQPQVREAGLIWLSLEDAIGAALPTPVRKLLLSLK
jgi:A/G-specific adenine glycosylase